MPNARTNYLNKRRSLVANIKATQGCKVCGVKNPKVLEFHHRNASTKIAAITKLRYHKLETLLAEIDKCDIYCVNHHHILELEAGMFQTGSIIRVRREEMRNWLNDIKKAIGCSVCGIADPRILRFNGTTKPDVQQMWHQGSGKERILKGIQESVLYCLNCHRLLL